MTIAPPIGRVYRMNWLFRIFGMVFALGGSCGVYRFGQDLFSDDLKPKLWGIVIAAAFVMVGCGIVVHGFVSRLVFSGDSLDHVTYLGKKSLPFASIRGRREYVVRGSQGGSTTYLRLESNDQHPALEFGKDLYRFDSEFRDWFGSLPDLDAMDKASPKLSNFGLV